MSDVKDRVPKEKFQSKGVWRHGPSFTFPRESFYVRSMDISVTPNQSRGYYTQYPEPSQESFQ